MGISATGLFTDAEMATLHKLRIRADGQYVVRFDEGEATQLSVSVEKRLLDYLEHAYATCDVVIVSDYGYSAISPAILDRLIALRVQQPRPLIVDAKFLQRYRAAHATMVTPNHMEARQLIESRFSSASPGIGEPPTSEQYAHWGRQLLTLLDAEHAAITLAADGVMLVSRSGATQHMPAYTTPHANTIGAGDTFTAAVALALGAHATPASAVRIGIDAASIAVTQANTISASYQELLQRVSLRAHTAHAGISKNSAIASRQALQHLRTRLEVERQAGNTIVFTNGVFDVLHAGHIELLRRAKALGDILVVAVNSDRVAQQLKGAGRPIIHERDRLALVSALDSVDYALLFDEETPSDLIRLLRPHIHVKGGDYDGASLPESEAVRAVGGRIVIVPLIGNLSTSAVIGRITALAAAQRTSEGSL